MKPAPTLIDELYRYSFKNTRQPFWANNANMRQALQSARRFVLDEGMATLLGELSTAAFMKANRPGIAGRLADQLRYSARLPHNVTWVEFPLRAVLTTAAKARGEEKDFSGVPEIEGWLLLQHPQLETAFQAIVFVLLLENKAPACIPVAYGWNANDAPLPWLCPYITLEREKTIAEVCTGILNYQSPYVNLVQSNLLAAAPSPESVAGVLGEWAGCLRRMWTFLATVNDLPIAMTEVKQSRGFLGKGNYRRYLDHRTVTLTVPAAQYKKLARKAILLARKRAHQVRGHWRDDWRHPLATLCEHVFVTDLTGQICQVCKGRKSWIHEHLRGDATLGFVTHDYRVQQGKV